MPTSSSRRRARSSRRGTRPANRGAGAPMTGAAHRAQVIVVGAGPVGFITAYGLARKGIEVRLLEAHAKIASSPRAAIYFPTTLQILDRLGLLEEAQAIGYASTRFAMRYPRSEERRVGKEC